ncbi:hypothetical protein RE474_10925 [Methanolobus sediminis]|uniref:Uncharacterized protein n=1 Tax=Methanolobus sediminis TaxID=3072978 RepID=A0AA51UJM3_9EURY|nr:hypothetical protein [Methanolobus sediminis]WMW24589.1 hypothetical protein RE474_10925 [Methanolobus sediminis]
MKQKLDVFPKMSSVDILKSHIEEISVKCLDNNWIHENKIDLNSLMEDKHYESDFKVSSRHFYNNQR